MNTNELFTEQDAKLEAEITSMADSVQWTNIVGTKIKHTRREHYMIGGILVKQYETLPLKLVVEGRKKIREAMNVSNGNITQWMRVYSFCRVHNIGASYVELKGTSVIDVMASYAKDDFDKVIQCVEFLNSNPNVKLKFLIENKLSVTGEVTFLRFGVTPEQKGYVIATLSEFPGHQGEQLVSLIEVFNKMKHSKAA